MVDKINNGVISTLSALSIPDFNSIAATYGRAYVDYGSNNKLPNYIADLYTLSPTHQAVVDSKRSILDGDLKIIGVDKKTDKLDLDNIDGEGDTIFDLLSATYGDLALYESFYWEIVYNKARTRIVHINHIPYETVRVGKYNERGKIEKVFISPDWSRKYIKKNKPKEFETFNPSKINTDSQILISKIKRPNQPYYTIPSYMSAVQYILLEDDIAELQRNTISNGFFPSMVMNFFNGEPTEDDKAELEGYDGAVVYSCNPTEQFSAFTAKSSLLEDEAVLLGSQQFAMATKLKDGDRIRFTIDGVDFDRLFRIDTTMKGTIALNPTFDMELSGALVSSYRFKRLDFERAGN